MLSLGRDAFAKANHFLSVHSSARDPLNAMMLTTVLSTLALSSLAPVPAAGQSTPEPCAFPQSLVTYGPTWKRFTVNTELLFCWYSFDAGQKHITLTRNERPSAAEEWDKQDYVLTTDMAISDVAFLDGGATLFVAGLRDGPEGCIAVIEQWDLDFPEGSIVATTPRGPAPGAVSQISPLPATIIVGGTYIAPGRRSLSSLGREVAVLYEGTPSTLASSIEADPEGRYLLARFDASGDLYSIGLTPGSQPLELKYSATTHSELAEARGDMIAFDHQTLGRFYQINSTLKHRSSMPEAHVRVYVLDSNNDGLLDGILEIPDSVRYSTPFGDFDLYNSLVKVP